MLVPLRGPSERRRARRRTSAAKGVVRGPSERVPCGVVRGRVRRGDSRVKRLTSRVKRIDSRVKRIESRVKRIDSCLKRIDSRVKRIDSCLKRIDSRADGVRLTRGRVRRMHSGGPGKAAALASGALTAAAEAAFGPMAASELRAAPSAAAPCWRRLLPSRRMIPAGVRGARGRCRAGHGDRPPLRRRGGGGICGADC